MTTNLSVSGQLIRAGTTIRTKQKLPLALFLKSVSVPSVPPNSQELPRDCNAGPRGHSQATPELAQTSECLWQLLLPASTRLRALHSWLPVLDQKEDRRLWGATAFRRHSCWWGRWPLTSLRLPLYSGGVPFP